MMLIFANGGAHMANYIIYFVLASMVANPRALKKYFVLLVLSFIASSFRIIPALIAFKGSSPFIGGQGYPNIEIFIESFVYTRAFDYIAINPQNWLWPEYSYYMSIIGFAFIMVFGVRQMLEKQNRSLLISSFFIIICSFGYVWMWTAYKTDFILFTGERVPTRFVIIPISILILFVGINMQRYLDLMTKEKRLMSYSLACFLFVLYILSMVQFFTQWKLERWGNVFSPNSHTYKPGMLSEQFADFPYLFTTIAGASISFLFIIYWYAINFTNTSSRK